MQSSGNTAVLCALTGECEEDDERVFASSCDPECPGRDLSSVHTSTPLLFDPLSDSLLDALFADEAPLLFSDPSPSFAAFHIRLGGPSPAVAMADTFPVHIALPRPLLVGHVLFPQSHRVPASQLPWNVRLKLPLVKGLRYSVLYRFAITI